MESAKLGLTSLSYFRIFLTLTAFLFVVLLFTKPSIRIRALWSTEKSESTVLTQPIPKKETDESNRSRDSETKNGHATPQGTSKSQSSVPSKKETNSTAPRETSPVSNSTCNMPQRPSYPVLPPQDRELHEQLLEYVEFHKKARACVLDPNCKQKPKILVATCAKDMTCLGLGDRMRGLMFSFTIALITKRVYFLHEFSFPYPLRLGFSPNAIDWTLPPTVNFNHSWPYLEWYWCRKGNACTGDSPKITEFSNFNDEGPDINMKTDDIVKLFDDKPVVQLASRISFRRVHVLQENPYLKDTYAGLSKFLIKRQNVVHRLLFQPSEATRQMMKAAEFEGNYISVHMRTGVDAGEVDNKRFRYISSHQREAVDLMIECIERVGGKNITNVFVASDSASTKELFTKRAAKKGYEVHEFRKRTVHYGRLWALGTTTWDALCEGFITVFSDLFLLSRGQIMLFSGSNFADLASNLAQGQRVIQLSFGSNFVEQKCRPIA